MSKELKFFLIAFILSLPFWWGINIFQGNLENYFYAQISQPLQEISQVQIPPKTQKLELELQAKSAISIKVTPTDKTRIIFKKNIHH